MKTETLGEFLARGGKVTVVSEGQVLIKAPRMAVQAQGGAASVITYEDCELFYSEQPDEEDEVEGYVAPPSPLNKELTQLRTNFELLPKPLKDKELIRLKAMVRAGEIEDNGYFEEN
jgi:hypothetical protein